MKVIHGTITTHLHFKGAPVCKCQIFDKTVENISNTNNTMKDREIIQIGPPNIDTDKI